METTSDAVSPFQLQSLVTFGRDEDILNLHNDASGTRPAGPAQGATATALRALIVGGTSTNKPAPPSSDKVEIRCAEGFECNLYLGCSDGTVRWYTLNEGSDSDTDPYTFAEARVLPTRKPVTRIALIPRLSKGLVLSDSTLYFFLLPSLEPIPIALINPLRGILTFAIDDNEPERPDEAGLCVLTRKGVGLWALRERLMPVKEVPLPYRGLVAKCAGSHMFIANEEFYNFVDLVAGESTPFAPIPATAAGAAPARPIIVTAAPNEFLIACDGGAGSMGLFLKNGDPVRGTLEWPLLPRALAVDWPYIAALLPDSTLEIHSAEELKLVQTLSLPTVLATRALSSSTDGFYAPSNAHNENLRSVSFQLIPAAANGEATDPGPDAVEPAGGSGLTPPSSPGLPNQSQTRTSWIRSRLLVVGSNGIQAVLPLTPAVQAESMLSAHRLEDALQLIDVAERKLGLTVDDDQAAQFRYIRQRVGLTYLAETQFEKAGEVLYKGRLDPRLLIKLFTDLRGNLLSPEDKVEVFAGVKSQMAALRTIDQIVQNYSPHLEPDVETAPSSTELQRSLDAEARGMILRYLLAFRRERPLWLRTLGHTAGIDRILDTVLVKLLAEEVDASELYALLELSKAYDAGEVETWLRDLDHYGALVRLYTKKGQEDKLLETLVNIADGVWVDDDVENPIPRISELIHASRNRDLVQKYGLWLLKKDPIAGLKAFTARDPKRAVKIDELQVLEDMLKVDEAAGEQFLEYLVVQRKNSDPRLHDALAKRYVGRVVDILQDDSVEAAWNEIAAGETSAWNQTPFLLRFALSSQPLDHRLARLKAALFLQSSSSYDLRRLRAQIAEYPVLTLENAILNSKSSDHRAVLQTLVHDLHDFPSAQSYCTSGGDVIPSGLAKKLLSSLKDLQPLVSFLVEGGAPGKGKKAPVNEEDKRELLGVLVRVQMAGGDRMASQTAHLLNAQAMYLDAFQALADIPSSWPLAPVSPFLNRSYRHALHEKHEGQILKGISLGQNLEAADRAWEISRAQGAVIEEPAEGDEGLDAEKSGPYDINEKLGGMENDDVVDIQLDRDPDGIL